MWCTVGLAHDTVSHISPVTLPLMTTRQAQSKNKVVDHQSTLWVKEDIKLLSISLPYNGWISVQLNTVHTTTDSWILRIAHNVQTTHRQEWTAEYLSFNEILQWYFIFCIFFLLILLQHKTFITQQQYAADGSRLTQYRSFWMRVFPGSHLHWQQKSTAKDWTQ